MKRIGTNTKELQEIPICNPDVKKANKYSLLPDSSRFDVSKLASLNGKLKNMKQSNKSNDFVDQIGHVLDLFDVDELKYSYEVVFFVMTEVERFLLVSKGGEQKSELVAEVCKRFFNDDPQLVSVVVELLMHRLPQVKMVGRIVRRVYRYFLKRLPSKSSQQLR